MQSDIIAALGVAPTIDPDTEITRRVQFLVDYLDATGAKGYVLGISGGQDSTLAGRLAQLALQFIQPDETVTVDIEPATTAMAGAVADALETGSLGDFNKGNAKARMRMIAQYAIAGERGLLVVGTDHAAENVTGFFTKHGDGAADLVPLAGLSKRQGAALLDHFGAEPRLWEKVPTADLEEDRPALPDEDALGITYAHIDDYLEGKQVPQEAAKRLEHLWRIGQHKRHLPPGPNDTWWR